MKLRIITSMLLVVFLSVCNSLTASAHDGCKDNCHRHHRHHGNWGRNAYMYGPDGCYAKHKACCDKKEDGKCGGEAKSCCKDKCGSSSCNHTYRRARYHEDCCGRGHVHCADKDNDDDDK